MAERDGEEREEDRLDVVFAVLDVIARIPRGSATSYGAIGAAAGATARQVGHILSRHGDEVPWHRVVHADGSPAAPHLAYRQLALLAAEGVPLRRGGRCVDLAELQRRGQAPRRGAQG